MDYFAMNFGIIPSSEEDNEFPTSKNNCVESGLFYKYQTVCQANNQIRNKDQSTIVPHCHYNKIKYQNNSDLQINSYNKVGEKTENIETLDDEADGNFTESRGYSCPDNDDNYEETCESEDEITVNTCRHQKYDSEIIIAEMSDEPMHSMSPKSSNIFNYKNSRKVHFEKNSLSNCNQSYISVSNPEFCCGNHGETDSLKHVHNNLENNRIPPRSILQKKHKLFQKSIVIDSSSDSSSKSIDNMKVFKPSVYQGRRILTAQRRSASVITLVSSPVGTITSASDQLAASSVCCKTGYEQDNVAYLLEREENTTEFKKRSPQV